MTRTKRLYSGNWKSGEELYFFLCFLYEDNAQMGQIAKALFHLFSLMSQRCCHETERRSPDWCFCVGLSSAQDFLCRWDWCRETFLPLSPSTCTAKQERMFWIKKIDGYILYREDTVCLMLKVAIVETSSWIWFKQQVAKCKLSNRLLK